MTIGSWRVTGRQVHLGSGLGLAVPYQLVGDTGEKHEKTNHRRVYEQADFTAAQVPVANAAGQAMHGMW